MQRAEIALLDEYSQGWLKLFLEPFAALYVTPAAWSIDSLIECRCLISGLSKIFEWAS